MSKEGKFSFKEIYDYVDEGIYPDGSRTSRRCVKGPNFLGYLKEIYTTLVDKVSKGVNNYTKPHLSDQNY